MTIYRRDLVQAARGQPRYHRADVRERHELVFANRDGRRGHEDARRIHAVQIDGFGKTKK